MINILRKGRNACHERQNPTEINFIYYTFCFLTSQSIKHNIVPVITFDQPLWLKATNIIQNQPEDSKYHSIVLTLAVFNAQMSFLGSIVHIMSGSGLQEILWLTFSGNAVLYSLLGLVIFEWPLYLRVCGDIVLKIQL